MAQDAQVPLGGRLLPLTSFGGDFAAAVNGAEGKWWRAGGASSGTHW